MKNEINISAYAENSYLEYAMSVVKGRAIASVQDGFKPVHRRIVYAMYKMGITDSGLPTKSARITGEVLGKYHPHGDVAVYEAMVNMTQNFRMRYPVIEGQGNFGSRDGDGAAAARYTECKFYPVSKILFDELNEDAVNLIPNYDGKESEPEVLPAKLPMILLNTTEGIGVGMATYIPSHNMKEVTNAVIAYLNNDKITLKEVLEYIKGPDFPTGAQIITSKDDMEKVYTEGRGAFRMRAKYIVEHPGTKNWSIVFNQLPYGISVKNILEEIDGLLKPETKAKKDPRGRPKVSSEQLRLKQLFNNLISDFKDETDRTNPLRLVIYPKSYKQDPEELINLLLGSTSLESNFSSNFVLIGLDGRPGQKGLMEILSEWTTFRLQTIERRCKYHIAKIGNRLHILDGRKIILHHIDEVIQIVKNSNDPRQDLINKYGLSEIQANDVLELKLRQLGNLELSTLEKEYKELSSKKVELEKIIATEKSLKKQMIKELTQDMDKFGDERATEIIESQKVDLSLLQQRSAKIAEEDITVAISQKCWIKTLKGQKVAEEVGFKEGDSLDYQFYCKNTDTLAIFDVEGKVYNYPLNELGKDGVPIASLGQMNTKLALVTPINKAHKYLIAQDRGFGFIVTGENLMTRMKAGKEMVKMVEGSNLMQPLSFKQDEDMTNYRLAVITTENKVLVYKLSEVSEIAKGKGITICGLVDGAKIKSLKIITDMKLVFSAIGKKDKEEIITLENDALVAFEKGRATKGVVLPTKDKTAIINFK